MTIGHFLQTATTTERNIKHGVNIFDQLKTVENAEKRQTEPRRAKVSKPPPIVITDKSQDVSKLMAEVGIAKYNRKMISIGTKLFFENDDDSAKTLSYVKEHDVEFFTHTPKCNKIFKVVLHGLPAMEIGVIKTELESLNIQPIQIIQMTLRNPSPHRALYLFSTSKQRRHIPRCDEDQIDLSHNSQMV